MYISVNQDCWIGLTMSENRFQWVDRSMVDYYNWHSGMHVLNIGRNLVAKADNFYLTYKTLKLNKYKINGSLYDIRDVYFRLIDGRLSYFQYVDAFSNNLKLGPILMSNGLRKLPQLILMCTRVVRYASHLSY